MNLNTKSLVAVVTLVAVALVVAWRESRMTQVSRMALAAAVEKRAMLETRIGIEEGRVTALEREWKALQAMLAGLRSAPAKARPVYKPVHINAPAEAAMWLAIGAESWQEVALQKNPRLQAGYLASERTNLALRYGPLLQRLGLTPDQTEKFNDLMAEHTARLLDLKLTARAQGITEPDQANATLIQQADERLSAAQLDLLGDAGYQQLQEYERTLPVREQAGMLAGALALTDTPLSTQQAEQITQIIANASKGYQGGGRADMPMPGNGELLTPLMLAHQAVAETIDWGAVLTQARGVLSESQFALFEASVTKDQSVVRLFNLIQQSPEEPMVGFAFGRR